MEVVLKFLDIFEYAARRYNGFNPCFDGSGSEMIRFQNISMIGLRFNPCFDGSGSEIWFGKEKLTAPMCFNPCFDGSGSEILSSFFHAVAIPLFQSLF